MYYFSIKKLSLTKLALIIYFIFSTITVKGQKLEITLNDSDSSSVEFKLMIYDSTYNVALDSISSDINGKLIIPENICKKYKQNRFGIKFPKKLFEVLYDTEIYDSLCTVIHLSAYGYELKDACNENPQKKYIFLNQLFELNGTIVFVRRVKVVHLPFDNTGERQENSRG